jgi:hypothetical protein
MERRGKISMWLWLRKGKRDVNETRAGWKRAEEGKHGEGMMMRSKK